MSPILIRPVREQIEHDRIIRVLQARLRKEFAVEANLGDERRVPVRVGEQLFYPDLVLTSSAASKKVQTIIEVETTESVNHLEAMAEWAHYGRARAPFHLYVPSGLVDIARRLIESYKISVAQLWSYSPLGDQVHFWLVSGDGDGGIVTSVTDSISSAEPVRPVVPPAAEAPAPGAEETAEAATLEKPGAEVKAAREVRPAPAAGTAAKVAAKPGAAAAKPAPQAAGSAGAAPKPAVRPAAKAPATSPAKPVAKPVAKPAAKVAKSAGKKKAAPSKPATKKAAARVSAKKAAARPVSKKPAVKKGAAARTPKRPAASKPAAKKPAARKPAARKPAPKPAARKAAGAKAGRR